MEYDETLKKIGEFGYYQRRVYFLVCLIAFPALFNNLGYVFWAARLDHTCDVERPNSLSNLSEEEWKNITIPTSEKNGKLEYESCLQYNLDGFNFTSLQKNVTEKDIQKEPLLPCESWRFDLSEYHSSIVIKYNLVCERKWFISVGQSVYMASRVGGNLGLGAVADRFGRRKTILISILLQVVSAVCISFAPDVYSFILVRSICAVFSTGAWQTIYVLVMEIVGPSWRVFAGTVIMVYWAVGYIVLAGIAYFIRDDFTLQLVLSLPFILMLLFYWVIPESPRWLLVKNRKAEAMKIIHEISKVNKKALPEELDIILADDKKPEQNSMPWYEYFKSPYLWRMSIVLFVTWFTNSVVYYGISMNTSDLAGDDYFNFFISGAVEIPAYGLCFILLKKFGRQIPLLTIMITAGLSMLATAFIPLESHIAIVTLAMIGKFCITCSYGMIYIYTSELYPTTARSMGLGICSTMSRFGGILAPFASELGQYYPGLPLIFFGVMSTASGIGVITLPETKSRALPQTIQEGEDLAKHTGFNRFCGKISCNKKTTGANTVPSKEEEEAISPC